MRHVMEPEGTPTSELVIDPVDQSVGIDHQRGTVRPIRRMLERA